MKLSLIIFFPFWWLSYNKLFYLTKFTMGNNAITRTRRNSSGLTSNVHDDGSSGVPVVWIGMDVQ